MNVIFKKLYVAIPFTILLPLILCVLDPFLYGFDMSTYLLKIFSMNLSLLISAVLLFLFYYLRYRRKNTLPVFTDIILCLFSLSIGLVFLNISQIPSFLRMVLWFLSLIGISYYFKNTLVNIILTVFSIVYFLSHIFILPIISHIIDLPTSYVKLAYLASSIVILFISNIPFISKNYPKFSLTYKIISVFIIIQHLLSIFINTSFEVVNDYPISSFTNYNPPLLLLSIIPTALALLSFTTIVLNKKRLSSYLKLEVCLSILLSIVMIFIVNFPTGYSSLILTGLYFVFLIITMYYLSYNTRNPYLFLFTNISLLYCVAIIITISIKIFGILGLYLIIPLIIYLILSVFLTLPLNRIK